MLLKHFFRFQGRLKRENRNRQDSSNLDVCFWPRLKRVLLTVATYRVCLIVWRRSHSRVLNTFHCFMSRTTNVLFIKQILNDIYSLELFSDNNAVNRCFWNMIKFQNLIGFYIQACFFFFLTVFRINSLGIVVWQKYEPLNGKIITN